MYDTTEVIKLAREIFDDEQLELTTKLEEAYGYDSMAHVQFIVELEGVFNISLEDGEISRTQTFEEVWKVVAKKVG